jgi:hypothetical protein
MQTSIAPLFIGAATAEATTITIPTGHQMGDLLIIYAFRDGSTAAPTVPSGWTTAHNATGANTCSGALGWKIAASNGETSGTWTNASGLACAVYRGTPMQTALGTPTVTNGTGTSVTYGTVSPKATTGWIAAFAGHRSVDPSLGTAPSGMTNHSVTAGATAVYATHDTNGKSSGFTSTAVSVGGTASGWQSVVVEIKPPFTNLQNYMAPTCNINNAGVISIFTEKIR